MNYNEIIKLERWCWISTADIKIVFSLTTRWRSRANLKDYSSKNSILTDLIVVEMEIFLEWVLYLVLALFIETNIL